VYEDAAQFYDVIHEARGRDAAKEVALVRGEILRRCPHAASLLDVGCGTGAHLPHFAETFDVVGLDSSPRMLGVAASRVADTELVEGDFRSFDLGRTFDAITSLFSGIGYLTEVEELHIAILNMAKHLAPGGALLIEGWVEPEYWIGSTVTAESGHSNDLAVARAVRSEREGLICTIEMRYVAATPEHLVSVDEQHIMRLSDPAEFAGAYEAAGLTFERLPHMLHPGRSVFVGARR
jgi:SAM-dependent methyltransferase